MASNNNSNWNRAKIATRLGLSSRVQQIDVIDTALAALESSPLLREGLIPKLPKRSPRKRDDYKCGHCGMKKRNHYCVGNNENLQEDTDSLASSKKRKKSFKPLTVLLLDCQNEQTQQYLSEIKLVGERNIEVSVRYADSDSNGIFNVYAEASWGNNKQVYIGQLSDHYKEYVKTSIDDGTLVQVELAPLEEILSPELNRSILLPQLALYRSTSWRTKRLSEIEWMNTSKKKKFKSGDGSPSHSESEPSSPAQYMPPQPTSPRPHPLQEDQQETNTINRQKLLVQDMLTTSPLLSLKHDSTNLCNTYQLPKTTTHPLLSNSTLLYPTHTTLVNRLSFDNIPEYVLGEHSKMQVIQGVPPELMITSTTDIPVPLPQVNPHPLLHS